MGLKITINDVLKTHMSIAQDFVLCIISSFPDRHMLKTVCIVYRHVMLDLIYNVNMRDIIVPHAQEAVVTRLLLAVRDGDIVTVRRLVTEGHVDVNVTDEVGVSSLSSCYTSLEATHSGPGTVGVYSVFVMVPAASNTYQWKDFVPKYFNIYYVITKVIHAQHGMSTDKCLVHSCVSQC